MMSPRPKSIAIIGAGLAGLSLAFNLQSLSKEWKVVLFDAKQRGASRIASGLLHPFSSDFSRQVPHAKAAMLETSKLFGEVKKEDPALFFIEHGILKIPLDNDQLIACSHLPEIYENLSWLPPDKVERLYPIIKKKSYGLLIESGKTIFTNLYLDSLLKKVQSLGVEVVKEVSSIKTAVSEFDITFLCMGQSLHSFLKEHLKDNQIPIQLIKGQLLECEIPSLKDPLKYSILAKGYLGLSPKKGVYYLGGTYEHRFVDEKPDQEIAIAILKDYFAQYTDKRCDLKVLSVQAGVRVAMKRERTPQILKLSNKLFAITGLGSKGLLYHGLLGSMAAEACFYGETSRILDGFFSTLDINF